MNINGTRQSQVFFTGTEDQRELPSTGRLAASSTTQLPEVWPSSSQKNQEKDSAGVLWVRLRNVLCQLAGPRALPVHSGLSSQEDEIQFSF